jgi:hypothetical protein
MRPVSFILVLANRRTHSKALLEIFPSPNPTSQSLPTSSNPPSNSPSQNPACTRTTRCNAYLSPHCGMAMVMSLHEPVRSDWWMCVAREDIVVVRRVVSEGGGKGKC